MAEIIEFEKRMMSPGNGALEKMREYFETNHDWPNHIPTVTEADYFLGWLWQEGFKIVPVDCDQRMVTELRRLFALYGHQATADVLGDVGGSGK